MNYLVDEDGKLVTDDTVYVEIGASGNPNACVLSLCSDNQEINDIIEAWGKTSAVFSSQEPGTAEYTITVGDDFVNVVEETATPTVKNLPSIFHRANTETASSGDFVVDKDGNVILSEDGLAISKTSTSYNLSDKTKSTAVAALYGVSPIVFEVSGSYATQDEELNAYGQTWEFKFSSGNWVVSPALEAYTE